MVVERADGFYYAVHADGKWSAYQTSDPAMRYDPNSTQEPFSAPLGNRESWLHALQSRAIVDCDVCEEEVTLVLAFSTAIADGLRSGTLVPNSTLQGMVGWRCRFVRGPTAYRLRSIESVETQRIRAPGQDPGSMVWVPHPQALEVLLLLLLPGTRGFAASAGPDGATNDDTEEDRADRAPRPRSRSGISGSPRTGI